MMGLPSWGPLTINGNGKLDHKVRQASRLVQMLRRTGDASRPLSRISPGISRLREPKCLPLTLNGLDVATGATANCSMGRFYSSKRCERCGGLMVLVMPVDGKGPGALRCWECDRIDPLQLPSIAAWLVGELHPPK